MENAPMMRFVRHFVDVKRKEVGAVFLFSLMWFFVILVFQVLKPLKSGLFVENLGAKVELYAKLANIGVAVLAVIVFTYLYNRLGSRRLVVVLSVFFILALLGFSSILATDQPSNAANWAFYLFGDAWSTIWVPTLWAYLNEMRQTEQSKRLYGVIGGGAVIGGLVGGIVVWQLVKPLGTSTLLVGCAVATGIIGLIIWGIETIASKPDASIGRQVSGQEQMSGERKKMNAAVEGARLVFASRYLIAIVMIVFLYELGSQIMDYQYKAAAESLEGTGATQAFFGQIGTIVGVISVVTQFFLVSFVVRTFGLTTALLILPVTMAIASGVYFTVPILWTSAFLYISDNAFSYSINQTARETLFVPMSADIKYKARAFANMFVQRTGKSAAILMAFGLTAIPIRFLSILGVIVIVIWSGFALYAGRRFDVLTSKQLEG
jgi:ATP:ADP antiporter, AAA family